MSQDPLLSDSGLTSDDDLLSDLESLPESPVAEDGPSEEASTQPEPAGSDTRGESLGATGPS